VARGKGEAAGGEQCQERKRVKGKEKETREEPMWIAASTPR
jgi:hypothetical protein